ncbi:MAG: Stp1/IreP family PP2C-type Ser/Thr phosphatase [Bacilli bacterium]|nr:Stp1/IreP family PP2C-type Ser/Thr phosphatase [Bacilli bacterium]MDD4006306.1 Stp1/IreP family PP2C-type Ser/Thr phosphatase [Bacilli bacterium]
MRVKGRFAYRIDIGRVRVSNEDQATVITNSEGDILMLVCDGMGGHNKGDFASRTAISVLSEAFKNKPKFIHPFFAKRWLSNQIRYANNEIYNAAYSNQAYKDMGTTLVAALIIEDRIIVANIGDSRAYAVRYNALERLTEDQTYVDYLYRTGKITKEEISTHPKRHVLMNALGIYPSLTMDIKSIPYVGFSIMLCSDGLYNNISEQEIHAILTTEERPEQKVETLIKVANLNGGSDNIAVAYWEVMKNDQNR